MQLNINLSRATIIATIVVVVVFFGASIGGAMYYTGTPGFCGTTCHTMDEQYAAWKKDRHNRSNNPTGEQAGCIDCHFLPGDKYSYKAQITGLRHLFAYLTDAKAPLPIRPEIPDGACLQSGCHAKEKFQDTEIKYTEKVRFKHKVHFTEKALKGQVLSCDDCHFKVTADKHFEVPKDICFLCHLKLEKPLLSKAVDKVVTREGRVERISFNLGPSLDFNHGASKCSVCHTVPDQPLQKQIDKDDPTKKPITHQTLQKAEVPCESCHFELVKGGGEIETGNVVSNGCLTCHNRSKELIAKAGDGKLMHDEHVAKRTADCFDCHTVIEHRNRPDHLDFVRTDCQLCHEDQHKYQKILLAGTPVSESIRAVPQLMQAVNTNCMACHTKKTLKKGHAVRTGSGESCVGCHTPEHDKMLNDWKTFVEKEIKSVVEVEDEALQALAAAKDEIDGEKLKEAEAMLVKGREFLDIVRIGNGVHNKKYSIMILDEAIANFEDTLDLIDSGG